MLLCIPKMGFVCFRGACDDLQKYAPANFSIAELNTNYALENVCEFMGTFKCIYIYSLTDHGSLMVWHTGSGFSRFCCIMCAHSINICIHT